jgi:hypothetical protein
MHHRSTSGLKRVCVDDDETMKPGFSIRGCGASHYRRPPEDDRREHHQQLPLLSPDPDRSLVTRLAPPCHEWYLEQLAGRGDNWIIAAGPVEERVRAVTAFARALGDSD